MNHVEQEAIERVAEFYDISVDDAKLYYMDEVESMMRIMKMKEHFEVE